MAPCLPPCLPQQPPARPGGRSSRVLAAIYDSVGALVGEGAERITFPVIAERAGVTPTTLYRRWDDVDALLEEVAVAALTRRGRVGTRHRVARGRPHGVGAGHRPRHQPARAGPLPARDGLGPRPSVVASCPVTDRRHDQAREVVRRAVERGETAPSVDQVLDHVIAPLYHHVVFGLGSTTRTPAASCATCWRWFAEAGLAERDRPRP